MPISIWSVCNDKIRSCVIVQVLTRQLLELQIVSNAIFFPGAQDIQGVPVPQSYIWLQSSCLNLTQFPFRKLKVDMFSLVCYTYLYSQIDSNISTVQLSIKDNSDSFLPNLSICNNRDRFVNFDCSYNYPKGCTIITK